ncbi:MAG TPA: hypothetical protein VEL31_00525 [Ktedonobacteraceae bacterium]|nr:hypothetical protein [Ktedonobacteraceae bacterium]
MRRHIGRCNSHRWYYLIDFHQHFQWQIDDLIEYLCGHRNIRREGVLFLADGLSEADEQWLDERMIDWRVD